MKQSQFLKKDKNGYWGHYFQVGTEDKPKSFCHGFFPIGKDLSLVEIGEMMDIDLTGCERSYESGFIRLHVGC